jgi:hypothetical protein
MTEVYADRSKVSVSSKCLAISESPPRSFQLGVFLCRRLRRRLWFRLAW